MQHSNYERWIKLQQEVTAQKQDEPLYGKKFVGDRGYLHFDGRVGIGRANGSEKSDPAYRLLVSSELIPNHSFLPFLREDQRVRKFRSKPAETSEGHKRPHDKQFSTIKNRPIMYASHMDACVYSLYSNILSVHYEKHIAQLNLTDNVLAYRPVPLPGTERSKSNIDFAKELYEKTKSFDGDAGILLLDVSGFFDNLNHARLYEAWCRVLNVSELPDDHRAIYKNITSFRYVFADKAHSALGLNKKALESLRKDRKAVLCSPSEFNQKIKKGKLIHKNKSGRGIPQGSPISGLLANVYMIDFDAKVKHLVESMGGHYARYSDDIAILIEPRKLTVIYEAVKSLISDEGLRISTKKTDCFIYQKASGVFVNNIRSIEPSDTLNLKLHPQYLGFVFTEKEIIVRGNTLARRFRGGKAFLLKNERWKYFSLASKKTKSKSIERQVEGVRKKIRPVVHEAQKIRTERNKAKLPSASSRTARSRDTASR